MTYFDPAYYCKQNLTEKDRNRLEAFKREVEEILFLAIEDYEESLKGDIVDDIKVRLIKDFGETFKERLGDRCQDYLVAAIETYDDGDVKEVKDPETFIYEGEDEDDSTGDKA
jgi:hypothetical protein